MSASQARIVGTRSSWCKWGEEVPGQKRWERGGGRRQDSIHESLPWVAWVCSGWVPYLDFLDSLALFLCLAPHSHSSLVILAAPAFLAFALVSESVEVWVIGDVHHLPSPRHRCSFPWGSPVTRPTWSQELCQGKRRQEGSSQLAVWTLSLGLKPALLLSEESSSLLCLCPPSFPSHLSRSYPQPCSWERGNLTCYPAFAFTDDAVQCIEALFLQYCSCCCCWELRCLLSPANGCLVLPSNPLL